MDYELHEGKKKKKKLKAFQLMQKVALIPDDFLVPGFFPWKGPFQCLPLGSTRTFCSTEDSLVATNRNLLWLT